MQRKEFSSTSPRKEMLKELQAIATRSTVVAQGQGTYWNQDVRIKVLYDTVSKQYLTSQTKSDKSELLKGLPFMLIARRSSNEGTKLVVGQKSQEGVFTPMGVASHNSQGLLIEINAAGTRVNCEPTDLGIALLKNLSRPIEPNERLPEIKRNRYANHETMLAKANESILFAHDGASRLDLIHHEKSASFIVVLRRGAVENSHIMETQRVIHGKTPRLLFGPRNAEGTFLPVGHAILSGKTIQIHFADGREFSLEVDPSDKRVADLLPASAQRTQSRPSNPIERINPLMTSISRFASRSDRAHLHMAMENATGHAGENDELTTADLARLRGDSPIHQPIFERQRG